MVFDGKRIGRIHGDSFAFQLLFGDCVNQVVADAGLPARFAQAALQHHVYTEVLAGLFGVLDFFLVDFIRGHDLHRVVPRQLG